MTAAALARHEPEMACVVRRECGVVVVLSDHGPERATYGARMLARLAQDRSAAPEPGEWVVLRRWPDGPVTVEGTLVRASEAPLAPVLRLRPHGA